MVHCTKQKQRTKEVWRKLHRLLPTRRHTKRKRVSDLLDCHFGVEETTYNPNWEEKNKEWKIEKKRKETEGVGVPWVMKETTYFGPSPIPVDPPKKLFLRSASNNKEQQKRAALAWSPSVRMGAQAKQGESMLFDTRKKTSDSGKDLLIRDAKIQLRKLSLMAFPSIYLRSRKARRQGDRYAGRVRSWQPMVPFEKTCPLLLPQLFLPHFPLNFFWPSLFRNSRRKKEVSERQRP